MWVQPSEQKDLFYFMGDRFEYCKSWTAASGDLPTFRKNSGKYIQRCTMRAMTPTGQIECLGMACNKRQMGVTPMPSLDAARASHMAGNSMHLTVAAG